MSAPSVLLFLLLVLLSGMTISLIRAEGGFMPVFEKYRGYVPDFKRFAADPEAPPRTDPFTSGSSRFSQGRCTSSSECQTSGCSGEVCTSGGDVITTCEYSESFPSAQDLTCQCVQGYCGWE